MKISLKKKEDTTNKEKYLSSLKFMKRFVKALVT